MYTFDFSGLRVFLTGGGRGMVGMRERAAEFGGDVVWQTSPGRGFDIGVDIPWERGADGED